MNPDKEIDYEINECLQHLRRRGETVGFAESCTGGLVSQCLTERPGISDVFVGAVVSYSRFVKESVLDVSAPTIDCLGQVHRVVALQMARGARYRLGCDWTVGITGIAGPSGGSELKPVGTVCFGVCGPGVEYSDQQVFSNQSRKGVQQLAVQHVFSLLNQHL